jgi:DNA-binding CsgD family transcriptional regulator/PAS domain-containing protein
MISSGFSLSASDLAGLQASLQTLLSPFDHPTVDAWRLAVNRSLQQLLDADKATFALPPANGEREYFSEQFDYSGLRPSLPEWQAICEPRFHTIERAVSLGVFSRRMLFQPCWSAFRRSAYYNEFIVPLRAYDSLGIRVRAGREHRVCCLLVHHERPAGRRFGRRGVALARLLLPAFKSAVGSYLHLRELRAGLDATIDGLGEGVLLADATGTPVHQNPSLTRMLALNPERDRLEAALRRVAGGLARFAGVTRRTERDALPEPVIAAVRTAVADYRLRGTYLAGALDGTGTVVLVTVDRADATSVPVSLLGERGRLTARECEVALLLARGRSDAAIARTLGISVHTARHHAESVRLKLDVRSRADVDAAVRSLCSGPAALPSGADAGRH